MSNKGIYAAHRLYDECVHVANNIVVECRNGRVESIYPFAGELHSMLWYDAIVITKADCVESVFKNKEDFFTFLSSRVHDYATHVYGVSIEKDACIVARLL